MDKKDKIVEEDQRTGLIVLAIIMLFTLAISLGVTYITDRIKQKNPETETTETALYQSVVVGDKIYYERLSEETWKGEYYLANYNSDSNIDFMEVVSYDEYVEYIDNLNKKIESNAEENEVAEEKIELLDQKYADTNSNYIIVDFSNPTNAYHLDLLDCVEQDNIISLFGYHRRKNNYESQGYILVIPTNMPVRTNIKFMECYTPSEISNIYFYQPNHLDPELSLDKPIIYIYPTEETEVSIKLMNSDLITHIYPEYNNGWNVIAKPNGDLKDLNTGRDLYSLYYESKAISNFEIQEEGFVIKGEDTAKFLEEKLAILGLTERESEEFIIYWLPILESNKYNYIRFASIDEINENMPLKITPNPDNVIRILMTFKGLDNPIEVKEQELQSPIRDGFTVVEWGGSEIE